MKKFVVPAYFNGAKSPFTIYIGDPEPKHHPLHFQADWLSRERGGNIPQEIMDSIAKLRDLAEKNNVSFEELCVYALGAGQQGVPIESDGVADSDNQTTDEEEIAQEEISGDSEDDTDDEATDEEEIAQEEISGDSEDDTDDEATDEEEIAQEEISGDSEDDTDDETTDEEEISVDSEEPKDLSLNEDGTEKK